MLLRLLSLLWACVSRSRCYTERTTLAMSTKRMWKWQVISPGDSPCSVWRLYSFPYVMRTAFLCIRPVPYEQPIWGDWTSTVVVNPLKVRKMNMNSGVQFIPANALSASNALMSASLLSFDVQKPLWNALVALRSALVFKYVAHLPDFCK